MSRCNNRSNRLQRCEVQVSGLAARLKQAEKDAALYNSREALFGNTTTDYSEVKKLWETFEPYQHFWSIAASWKVTHLCLGLCSRQQPQLPISAHITLEVSDRWLGILCFLMYMPVELTTTVWTSSYIGWDATNPSDRP